MASFAKVIRVSLDALVEPAENPNEMGADDFALLVRGIREAGFLQPVLVRPIDGGRWEIVDGVHRARAAREAGLVEVSAVEADMDDRRARLLQLGLNRLRGKLDLTAASRVVADLHLAEPDLGDLMLSGFGEDDIAAMVRIAAGVEPDPVDEVFRPEPAAPAAPKPFAVTLTFDSAEELRKVKRALRRAAGKGVPLEVGLMRMIDGA